MTKKNINFSDKVTQNNDILVKKLDNSAVILNLNNDTYYGINETSYSMYKKLIKSNSIEQAFIKICSEFDAEPNIIKNDLIEFVQDLLNNKVIILEHNE